MTVIAFPRRHPGMEGDHAPGSVPVHGTFLSPRGRSGSMDGVLRVRRFVLTPGGLRLSGVFTAELREDDGTVIGIDSRRATVPVEVRHDQRGSCLSAAALDLDLMGISVHVPAFTLDPSPPALTEGPSGTTGRAGPRRGDAPW